MVREEGLNERLVSPVTYGNPARDAEHRHLKGVCSSAFAVLREFQCQRHRNVGTPPSMTEPST